MKAKYAISPLVIGFCLDFIGALLKILHTARADFMLTIAVVFKVLGALLDWR